MVALHTTVHDRRIPLLPDTLTGHLMVDPVRVSPHAWVNFAKLHRRTCVIRDGVFECRIEFSVIEEYVGVIEPSVEVPLDRLDGLYDPFKLLIARQHNECSVRSRAVDLGLGVETACHKDFVVFLTYLAARRTTARLAPTQHYHVGHRNLPY